MRNISSTPASAALPPNDDLNVDPVIVADACYSGGIKIAAVWATPKVTNAIAKASAVAAGQKDRAALDKAYDSSDW